MLPLVRLKGCALTLFGSRHSQTSELRPPFYPGWCFAPFCSSTFVGPNLLPPYGTGSSPLLCTPAM